MPKSDRKKPGHRKNKLPKLDLKSVSAEDALKAAMQVPPRKPKNDKKLEE